MVGWMIGGLDGKQSGNISGRCGHGGSISGKQSGNMSPHIVLDVKLTAEVGRGGRRRT